MKNALPVAILMIAIAVAGYLLQYHLVGRNEPIQANGQLADGVIDFTLADIDGTPRALSEWRGQALLVNFWATWCAPCRREIPLLKETQAKQAENHLQVIGIAVDFRDQVEAYAVDAQFNYPILIGQEDAMAAAEASGIEFIGMPFTLVVAPDGRLIKAHIGEIVAEHIQRIAAVVARLESGELDLEAAKSALSDL